MKHEIIQIPNPDRIALNPNYPHLKIKEKLYRSAEQLAERVDLYFDTLANTTKEVMSASGVIKNLADPQIPSLEEFAAFLGMNTDSLRKYTKAEGYEIFHDVLDAARDKILGMKMKGLINGKGSTAGLIFDLVNNHGMKNKSEVESDNKTETLIRVVYD